MINERAGRRASQLVILAARLAQWRRDCYVNSPIGRDTAESKMFQSQDRAYRPDVYIQASSCGVGESGDCAQACLGATVLGRSNEVWGWRRMARRESRRDIDTFDTVDGEGIQR